ncbi:MAG: Flp pilus assembly complex ATPase component TadA [Clostridia bacterium]|nr:Flp pilus assembly complex ATPase component TadA [Clostridia bacterium]
MEKEKRDRAAELVSRAASERILASGTDSDEKALEIIEECALDTLEELSAGEIGEVVKRVYGRLRGSLGILSGLLENDRINEIMVNGPDSVFVEIGDRLVKTCESFDSAEELEGVIRRIASSVHREINDLEPILDARLPDGSRVHAVLKNVAIGGPVLTVRKFRRNRITMDDMVRSGSLTDECAAALKNYVECGYNIFVSGGTSTGKTTFLNALADYIPPAERVITIEDSAELQMDVISDLVRLECRNANSTGRGTVTMGMLIKASLRMRPDRIIVGEVRGEEVRDMLQALNTGHSGMSTGHGNSSSGMLRRLEAMYLQGADVPIDAIRAQISEAIDLMVQLVRLPDGRRRVVSIDEIAGIEEGRYRINRLFEMNGEGKLEATGRKLENDLREKIRRIV